MVSVSRRLRSHRSSACMPSNWPVLRQQRQKATARAARAHVVPAEFLHEFSVDADDSIARFTRDSLERTPGGASLHPVLL